MPETGGWLRTFLAVNPNPQATPTLVSLLTVVLVYQQGRKLSEKEFRSAEGVVGDQWQGGLPSCMHGRREQATIAAG
jgi:hypothetical protein